MEGGKRQRPQVGELDLLRGERDMCVVVRTHGGAGLSVQAVDQRLRPPQYVHPTIEVWGRGCSGVWLTWRGLGGRGGRARGARAAQEGHGGRQVAQHIGRRQVKGVDVRHPQYRACATDESHSAMFSRG